MRAGFSLNVKSAHRQRGPCANVSDPGCEHWRRPRWWPQSRACQHARGPEFSTSWPRLTDTPTTVLSRWNALGAGLGGGMPFGRSGRALTCAGVPGRLGGASLVHPRGGALGGQTPEPTSPARALPWPTAVLSRFQPEPRQSFGSMRETM